MELIRTSQSHPLHIATLAVGAKGGAIGVTFAPGKKQAASMTGIWQRDLEQDLASVRAWGADDLISLIEPHEFVELAITELPARANSIGLRWHGLPITDGDPPDERFLGPWSELGTQFAQQLLDGCRIVVHCKGGLGRAGTAACLLLFDTRTAADAEMAMQMVRAVRPGAIETSAQEDFLRSWR